MSDRKITTCARCGTQYLPSSTRVSKYCSRQCCYASRKGLPQGLRSSVEVRCLNCDKAFIAYKSCLKMGYAKFCSKECKYPYMKAHRMFQPKGRSAKDCTYCG